tara:strand:- start:256 stop:384 length:129 start_codon:yes stop_codon:yes gene_type:complete
MKQHHNWSLLEIENMIPWEREVYMLQLQKWIQEENKRLEKHG